MNNFCSVALMGSEVDLIELALRERPRSAPLLSID
jgi:hypothetical protein